MGIEKPNKKLGSDTFSASSQIRFQTPASIVTLPMPFRQLHHAFQVSNPRAKCCINYKTKEINSNKSLSRPTWHPCCYG
jgi:hypothetical protein